eukprot:SAG31_NODE_12771_length_918_cov_1.124542_1_plen_202_part_01
MRSALMAARAEKKACEDEFDELLDQATLVEEECTGLKEEVAFLKSTIQQMKEDALRMKYELNQTAARGSSRSSRTSNSDDGNISGQVAHMGKPSDDAIAAYESEIDTLRNENARLHNLLRAEKTKLVTARWQINNKSNQLIIALKKSAEAEAAASGQGIATAHAPGKDDTSTAGKGSGKGAGKTIGKGAGKPGKGKTTKGQE